MKPHLAIVAAPFALLAACGVAWAQDVAQPLSAGVGDGAVGGIGASLLVVAIREARDAWLKSRTDERAETAAERRDAEREALRQEILRSRDLHNALAGQVGRLEERLTAVAAQAGQLHDDIGGMRGVLENIRDRMPRAAAP